jgi:chemotaxis protein methyltransferase CheR
MDLSPTAFDEIRKAVYQLCGVVVSGDKQYLVKSRLEPILRRNGMPSYEALVSRLAEPNSLSIRDEVIEAITTKETSFNRDGHPFQELRRTILPQLGRRLIERRAANLLFNPVSRIWCAAAAHGQEPYSVAMAVADYVSTRLAGGLTAENFPILASDISANALAAAREGRYTTAELARGLSESQRNRFFRQERGAWRIDPALRRMIEFRQLNLAQRLPDLGAFDLILCRNFLIYLDDDARRRLCQSLHSVLNPDGLLMIGAAESLYGITDGFELERLGTTVVYRKRS